MPISSKLRPESTPAKSSVRCTDCYTASTWPSATFPCAVCQLRISSRNRAPQSTLSLLLFRFPPLAQPLPSF